MKKAKILVPALAILALSVTASVTGTVAWFTTSTTTSVQFKDFGVKTMDGKLTTSLTAGVGTKITTPTTGDKYISAKTYGTGTDLVKMTHGSYDPASDICWTRIIDDITEKSPEDGKYDDATYFYFSWTITFTYDFGTASGGDGMNLYFDPASATTLTPTTAQSPTKAVERGFRMAFVNAAAEDWVVWSPLQQNTLEQNTGKPTSKYLKSNSDKTACTEQNYDASLNGNLIYQDEYKGTGTDVCKKIETSTGSAARKDCLGTFKKPTSGSSTSSVITIKVVTWFEGLDDNVISTAAIDKANIGATLSFYLRTNKAA